MPALNLDDAFTMDIKDPHWVVRDIIPSGTIVLVAGDAGVGKSVLNLSEGLHVALGRPFLGYPTCQTRVLYFDEENSRPDLVRYLHQLWLGMGQPDREALKENFKVQHFSLGRPDWFRRMSEIVAVEQPGLIYLDTATSALAIKEENENAEAQEAVQRLRRVMAQSAAEPAIKVLKHAKYQNSGGQEHSPRRTIRGAKAWLGAVDQVMFHIRAGAGRPRKDGLHTTILVPDKFRAYGLRRNIKILPSMECNGLIIKGETFDSDRDLMRVE